MLTIEDLNNNIAEYTQFIGYKQEIDSLKYRIKNTPEEQLFLGHPFSLCVEKTATIISKKFNVPEVDAADCIETLMATHEVKHLRQLIDMHHSRFNKWINIYIEYLIVMETYASDLGVDYYEYGFDEKYVSPLIILRTSDIGHWARKDKQALAAEFLDEHPIDMICVMKKQFLEQDAVDMINTKIYLIEDGNVIGSIEGDLLSTQYNLDDDNGRFAFFSTMDEDSDINATLSHEIMSNYLPSPKTRNSTLSNIFRECDWHTGVFHILNMKLLPEYRGHKIINSVLSEFSNTIYCNTVCNIAETIVTEKENSGIDILTYDDLIKSEYHDLYGDINESFDIVPLVNNISLFTGMIRNKDANNKSLIEYLGSLKVTSDGRHDSISGEPMECYSDIFLFHETPHASDSIWLLGAHIHAHQENQEAEL